ncbi:MAG: SsrA-binding protein SmpB [Elusimicrobiota bacterium]
MNGNTAARNKEAYYKYSVLKEIEAGISLQGCEVKSLREGRADIKHSFARIIEGEVFLINAHIAPYTKADSAQEYDPRRDRKLLLKKREIRYLEKKIQTKGVTIIPTRIYFKKGRAKLSVALAKGKTKADKRDSIKERITKREMDRERKKYI